MSYKITVNVKAGHVEASTDGPVPDGIYDITGHEDGERRDLAITRRAPDGRYVAIAQSTHYKEGV